MKHFVTKLIFSTRKVLSELSKSENITNFNINLLLIPTYVTISFLIYSKNWKRNKALCQHLQILLIFTKNWFCRREIKIMPPIFTQFVTGCINLKFSVPSRDCRNANVCLFVCHKRFLVSTWINWWIHGNN